MTSTFTILTVAALVLRLALNWLLDHRFGFNVTVPQSLACAIIILAGLPDLIKPFAYPLPLSITLGLLLPDLSVVKVFGTKSGVN